MNNFFTLLISILLFVGCIPKYNTYIDHSYIINQTDLPKFFGNDSLNLLIEIPHQVQNSNFNLGIHHLNKTQQQVLKLSGLNKKRDTLLYSDNRCIIALKNTHVNLESYRAFSALEEIVYKDLPISQGHLFRKTILDNKTHTLIYIDLIPRSKTNPRDYIQVLSYYQPERISLDRNAPIDAANPNDIIFFENWYRNTLTANRNNYKYTIFQPKIAIKNSFDLLNEFFNTIPVKNYYAAFEADSYSPNYRTPTDAGMFRQLVATYYSFANHKNQSDSLWALLTKNQTNETFKSKYIDDNFRNTLYGSSVIMFNEAHNSPNHRYFVGTMLQELYDHGFRYLGLEAFQEDSLFKEHGYPTMNNGFYLREPTFANLIRKAKNIGFTIFGYDSNEKDREQKQAENIYNIYKNTSDKILILGGYAHIYPERMAEKFHKISGIQPITIDQTSAYLQHLDNKSCSNKVYLIDSTGLNKPPKVSYLIWNDLKIESNIFSANESKKCTIEIPKEYLRDTKMVYIYFKEELERFEAEGGGTPIPTYVKILKENDSKVELLLGKGEYTICFICNKEGILHKYNLKI